MLDPLTSALLTLPDIRQMVDDIFMSEAQWLPELA
jgi:alpha-galactosidase/6-phospho-beta-glucosidase family protein